MNQENIQNKNKWKALLNSSREQVDVSANNNVFSNDSIRSPFLSDVDKITYSSYFRTLQDKTQVYPLSKSGSVRTRLTHSLETAGVGRTIGYAIGKHLVKKYNLHEDNISEHDFGYIIQAACLAHDIGNTPFGHLGEQVICEFFEENESFFKDKMSEEQLNSLKNFDGNSQGFRIITNLSSADKKNPGLKLTYATISTFCKYPRTNVSEEMLDCSYGSYDKVKNIAGTKKAGILETEKNIFQNIFQSLQIDSINKEKTIFFRHPLAFILEAADDICYNIADIEDAYAVRLIGLNKVHRVLNPIAQILHKEDYEKLSKGIDKVSIMRSEAIHNLVIETIEVFKKYEEEILSNTFQYKSLLDASKYKKEIQDCRDFSRKYIFNSPEKVKYELQGINAIKNILYNVLYATQHPNKVASKRLNVIFENRLSSNKDNYYKLFVSIIDQIASMSDSTLLEFYNNISFNDA